MPTTRWIVAMVALSVFACADRREPVAREHLTEKAASESGGALTLASMTKTNGFDHEREGMKLHTIEWEATLQVHRDGWKAGWRDFQVLPVAPNALAAAVEGASVRRVLRGGKAVLQGKSELQKADRGWRVLTSEVTASKIERPPDVASEGRSTDINSFFQAFKGAVGTRNKQVLAKFILFPNPSYEMPARTEAEFLASGFPFSDEEVQAIMGVPLPRQHENGSYGLPTDGFAIYFNKDRDGYWKWTDYYIAEGE